MKRKLEEARKKSSSKEKNKAIFMQGIQIRMRIGHRSLLCKDAKLVPFRQIYAMHLFGHLRRNEVERKSSEMNGKKMK